MKTIKRLRRERDWLIAAEEQAFRQKVERLFAGVQERQRPGCDGCGG
jgi:hypothetical protein